MNEGYRKLEPLSIEKCDSIVEQLKKIPFKAKTKCLFEVANQKLIKAIPEIDELTKDESILSIVRDYLGAEPILTQTSCWRSERSISQVLSRNAQMFHQDRTYKKFIKLFLYLNDVSEENGCHVYVPNSIRKGPQPPKRQLSLRVSDEYIYENYSEIVYLTGKKGAMTLVDTQGWHKGNKIVKGNRLLVQLEWSSDAIYLHTGKTLKYV